MTEFTIQDILPLVQKPSRYLGFEANRIKKPWEDVELHIALAFPDLYEIATSHFGIQILYSLLNAEEDILAERVFAPAIDMEALLREKKLSLGSLESAIPLKKFDIIGFSLLYELNYTNMVNMLDLSGIPFFTHQRKNTDPFVIAGGPCMCNPEPVAEFFDAIVVGDGEAVIIQMTNAWKAWRKSNDCEREGLLKSWSQIKGVYIPSFFEVTANRAGSQRLIPKQEDYQYVERAVVSNLDDVDSPSSPVIPFGKPIHDRLRMEIARGCTRGCRFCQAGMIYRPVRERQPEKVLSSVKKSLMETGYEDLSLLSLSTGDYSCIAPLMKKIMRFGESDHVAISLPSLRAGSLTPELMELIRKVRKTGFTIAPEAGSQRLRDVINKNINDDDITRTVENAFSLGWKVIKLYFMIGLPTEKQDDIEAIVDLVRRIKKIPNQKGCRGKINVSIATFVPKPHTPFQWESQISLEEAMQKLNWLKDRLSGSNIQVKWQDPRVSVIEGIWARGDRRLNQVLIDAWKSGCRFDGWTDFFNYERWMNVLKKKNIDPRTYVGGYADKKAELPWDHIRIGVDRRFLEQENDRAKDGTITLDCRKGSCSGCGVCDFTTLKPISFHDQEHACATEVPIVETKSSELSEKYMVTFSKISSARFLGHLEMVKIFSRSLRRARIPIKYSRGFHPMPKISFMDTLPTGMQSEEEQMIISLTNAMDAEELLFKLGRQVSDGIEITGCSRYCRKLDTGSRNRFHYHVALKDGFFLQKDLDCFFEQSQANIERSGKKGSTVRIDLKEAIKKIEIVDSQNAWMTLEMVNNRVVRPAQVMRFIFKLTDPQINTAIITKRKADHV
jgi:radical SAM family uncharacterized protein/radical SAM-linked protein